MLVAVFIQLFPRKSPTFSTGLNKMFERDEAVALVVKQLLDSVVSPLQVVLNRQREALSPLALQQELNAFHSLAQSIHRLQSSPTPESSDHPDFDPLL